MPNILGYLVGTYLQEVTRRETDWVIQFSDRSAIVVAAPWHWSHGGEFSLTGPPKARCLDPISQRPVGLYVCGIGYSRINLTLSVHLADQWSLKIIPEDRAAVAWIACTPNRHVISAGGGRLTVFQKVSPR